MIRRALSRMLGREMRAEPSFTHGGPPPEFLAARTTAGVAVNAVAAENLATVSACVGAIASAVASLPVYVYRPTQGGRTPLPDHPVARALNNPWDALSRPDWMEWAMGQVLMHGNCISEILHDSAGQLRHLRPIPWQYCQPATTTDDRLVFDVSLPGRPRRRLVADDVFFLRDRSDDGRIGRSRISRAPDVLGNAIALQSFAGHAWANQAVPSGVITLEGRLTDAQRAQLGANLHQKWTGTQNARRVLILDQQAKWQSISISPEDAEVLASRRFSVEEICRLYQVPPPIVQSYEFNTFTNSQQAALWFAQFTLAPWIGKIEAEFSRSVFIDDARLEIDMSGLVRGDFATRWQSYQVAIGSQILTVDEVREAEGYGPKGAAS